MLAVLLAISLTTNLFLLATTTILLAKECGKCGKGKEISQVLAKLCERCLRNGKNGKDNGAKSKKETIF